MVSDGKGTTFILNDKVFLAFLFAMRWLLRGFLAFTENLCNFVCYN